MNKHQKISAKGGKAGRGAARRGAAKARTSERWQESERAKYMPESPGDDLAHDMACFLWECSQLRHGLFTPAEFIPLVSFRLREYLLARALPNVKLSDSPLKLAE